MIPLLKRLARHLIFGKPRRVITPYARARDATTAKLRRELAENKRANLEAEIGGPRAVREALGL